MIIISDLTYPVCPGPTGRVETFFPEFHDMLEPGWRPMGRTLHLIGVSDPNLALDFEIKGMINIFRVVAGVLDDQIFPFFCPNLQNLFRSVVNFTIILRAAFAQISF